MSRSPHNPLWFILDKVGQGVTGVRSAVLLPVLCCAIGVLWADDPAFRPGFEEGHGYAHGPTDSLELRTLNPIVSQPLSPTYPILDDFNLQIVAHHTGFMWDTYPDVNGIVRSAFYGASSPGILGAGWYLNPGRIWYSTYVDTNLGNPCNRLKYAYVDDQDAITGFYHEGTLSSFGGRYFFNWDLNSTIQGACSLGNIHHIKQGWDFGDKRRQFLFDRPSGALAEEGDQHGNKIEYTYMTAADFDDIDESAAASDYTFNRLRYRHPNTGEFDPETILAPKTATDSLGRHIDFIYSRPLTGYGYTKFLLTSLEVDTPNGRSTYNLHYQKRQISSAPPGWPSWVEGPVTLALLVKVEIPPATSGATGLSYNYDYNEYGELVEMRYPSGARTVLTYGNVDVWKPDGGAGYVKKAYSRGVVDRTVVSVGGSSATWTYTKALYPPDALCGAYAINDRERSIVTDPVGNETEYRFSWHSYFRYNLAAVKQYQGPAPRYVLEDPNNIFFCPSLYSYETPYNGKLIRSTTTYYEPRHCDVFGEDAVCPDYGPPLERVTLTSFYDDDLMGPGTREDDFSADPGAWGVYASSQYINWETRVVNFNHNILDPLTRLPEKYGRSIVAGHFEDTNSPYGRILEGPLLGWEKTTEAGNLVGSPRTIVGNYEVGGHTWGFLPSRIIEQEGRKSRTDYLFNIMFPCSPQNLDLRATVERADPNGQEFHRWIGATQSEIQAFCGLEEHDVVASRTFGVQPGGGYDPQEYGQHLATAYSGGDLASPTTVEYEETLTNEFGSLKTRQYSDMNWLQSDNDVLITGQHVATRDSAGFEVTRTYDDIGRLVTTTPSETTGLGMSELPTTYTYNELTDEYEDLGGFDVSHTYSTMVTESRGTYLQSDYEVAKSYYDGQGRVIKEERSAADGGLVYRLRTYDAVGAMTCESRWVGYPSELLSCEEIGGTTYEYEGSDGHHDPFNRPITVTRPDASETEFEYFGLNTKTTVKGINGDPNTSATTIVYRDYKNRVRVVDAPGGADAIYSYDHLGNILKVRLVDQVQFDPNSLNTNRFAVTNSGGQERTFTYDTQGRLRTATHPEHGQEGHETTNYNEYDSRGLLRKMTDPALTEFKYSYDAAGRQTRVEAKTTGASEHLIVSEIEYANDPNSTSHGPYALGKAITEMSYAADGNTLVSVREQVYAGLSGRVSQERQRLGDSWGTDPNDVVVTTMEYNESGLLSELEYPRVASSTRIATRLAYEYSHGFLVGLESNRQTSDPNAMGQLITDVTYSEAGIPTSISLANGVVETWEPDVANRPGRIVVTKGSTELWDSGVYGYDGASNIISIGAQNYEYDLLGRLVASTTLSPIDPNVLYPQEYAYDDYGNMERREGAAGEEGTQEFVMDPNGTNRVQTLNPGLQNITYEYNALGGVTNDGFHEFGWDKSGRLTEVLTVDSSATLSEYSYDDRGYRLDRKTDGGHRRMLYLRDDNGQVLSEFAYPSSSLEPHWRKDYIYALGRHIAAVENTAPNMPSGVESDASDPNATSDFVEVSWLSVSDTDLFGYDVWRRSNPSDPNAYALLTWQTPDAASPYKDEGVVESSTYWYKVAAVDTAGVQSLLTAPLRVLVGDQYNPPVPGSFDVQFVPQSKAQATWSSVIDTNDQSDILGYDLYRKVNAGSWSPTPRNGSVPISGTSYMDTGLLACNTYHYRLKAVDAAGRESSYTSIKSVTVGGQGCGGGGGGGGFARNEWPSPSGHRAIGQQGPEEVNYGIVYYHVDHLGTPVLITASDGDTLGHATFFPFGDIVPGSGSDIGTHWFSGHELDVLFSGYYMLARYYSHYQARFASPDPGPTTACDPTKISCPSNNCRVPQSSVQTSTWTKMREATELETRPNDSTSRYEYVFSNPLIYVDPSGEVARPVMPGDDSVRGIGGGVVSSRPGPGAPRDPVRCKECLDACKKGTSAIQDFCRSIPPVGAYRVLRAACWAVQLASPVACSGFCYWYFC